MSWYDIFFNMTLRDYVMFTAGALTVAIVWLGVSFAYFCTTKRRVD